MNDRSVLLLGLILALSPFTYQFSGYTLNYSAFGYAAFLIALLYRKKFIPSDYFFGLSSLITLLFLLTPVSFADEFPKIMTVFFLNLSEFSQLFSGREKLTFPFLLLLSSVILLIFYFLNLFSLNSLNRMINILYYFVYLSTALFFSADLLRKKFKNHQSS